ncbi:MAG: malectin domain-containing carbohydrate-binding protein, partial [Limisphaerales bacterium]
YTPNTTYFYRVSGVNIIGEGADSVQVSATPTNGICDLVVTGINWTPTNAFLLAGDAVNFRATILNQGSAASPNDTHGIGFSLNGGQFFAWHSSVRSMPVGQSLLLAVNGSPTGVAGTNWIATPGDHTISANVDDVNRFPEAIEENNVLTRSFKVHAPSYLLNTGGGAVSPFAADTFFSGGGHTFSVTNGIDRSLVANPAPESVYQSERWGTFTYTVPHLLSNRTYHVRLHFAEIAAGVNAAGMRRFHVFINGTQVLTNFDIFAAAAGKHKAITREFLAPTDSLGQLAIQFAQGAGDYPKVSAIEILPPPPKIASVTVTNGNAIIGVQTFPRKTYRLQWKANLSDATWSTGSLDTTANGDTLSFTNAISTNQRRFYRVLQTN